MQAMKIHRAVLNLLAPRVRCMACEKELAQKNGLCKTCEDGLQPLVPACPVCGNPNPAAQHACRDCREIPPLFTFARQLYAYSGTARQLIHLMKYQGEYDLPAEIFTKGLLPILKEENWPVQLVVPVPSGRGHLYKYGYNQAAVLAGRLAGALRLPLCKSAIARKGGKSQVGLSRGERLENIAGQYRPGRAADRIKGKNILLVDDVFTTGATIHACASVLLKSGAANVYVLCAARSVIAAKSNSVQ